jgi:hypothetical protein
MHIVIKNSEFRSFILNLHFQCVPNEKFLEFAH